MRKRPQTRQEVDQEEVAAEFRDDAEIGLIFYTLFLFTIAMALTFCLWYFLQGPGSVGSWMPWSSDAVTTEVKVAPGEGVFLPERSASGGAGDTSLATSVGSVKNQASAPADSFVAKVAKKTKAEADHETL